MNRALRFGGVAAVVVAPWADPVVDWLECATCAVPLNHPAPDGPTVWFAPRLSPAQDGAARRALFLSAGGPGGTGTSQFAQWYGLLPAAVGDSFDIVIWDPRSIGESTGAQSRDSAEARLPGSTAFGAWSFTTSNEQRTMSLARPLRRLRRGGAEAAMCGDVASVTAVSHTSPASEAMLRSGYFGLSSSRASFPCARDALRP